jgi:hypothetical protein
MSCKRHQLRAEERKAHDAPMIQRRVEFYRERGYEAEAIARLVGVRVEDVRGQIGEAPAT